MKKSILIISLLGITSISLAQTKKPSTVKAPVQAPAPDSIKVAVSDLKAIFGTLSGIVNNSSDITTKQANDKDGINAKIDAIYYKWFPKEAPKQ